MSQRAKPTLISFPSFYATLYKKIHLNIFDIFAAARNLSLIVSLLLILSGDIEKNPGPVSIYTDVLKHIKQTEDQLKFINLNCRSLNRKRGDLKVFFKDFGHNTIIDLTETWLSSENDSKLWEIDSEKLVSFRCDRNLSEIAKNRRWCHATCA